MIVSSDGALTAVECKLEANPEKRRMVIGQVIDYASAISADGFDRFVGAWHARGGADLVASLTPEALGELRSRIESGTIGLCLAVDRIDNDLRRLVEYLNQVTQDRISVTALQLGYARHADLEILIPTTYGGEIAAAKATHAGSSRTERWSLDSFVGAVEQEPDQRFLARVLELLGADDETTEGHASLWFGARPGGGLFFHLLGLRYPPFQLWINAAGSLTIAGNWQNFPKLTGHAGFAELARFLGQDENGPARFVPVAGIDPDELWVIAQRAARAINA
ncbi:MAG: hypothetical protein Q8K58_13590 [Acidimicrobiales bacterium]|nr:hypothetical protein [Acidimicrobiales bacterium]